MNQSKYSKLIATWFVIGFIVVAFFQLRAHQPSNKPTYYPPEHELAGQLDVYSGLTRDASITYAPIIAGEREVTDWHSALYMYECRAVLRCARALSLPLDGVSVQIAFYYLHLFLLVAYASYLMYKTVEKSCTLLMLFVPLCLSTHFMFEWMALGLDFFFFVHLFIICCTMTLLPKIGSKRMKTIAWIVIAVSLFHAVNYRKNAILLVPFVAYIYVYTKYKAKERKITHLLRWASISICFVVVSANLIAWILPVRHTQPIIPMLGSDLRIAAVLRGEQNKLRVELLQAGASSKKVNHKFCDSLTAYWGDISGVSGAYEIYVRSWKSNPGSMLMARVIQTVEFYCGGSFPRWQGVIEWLYPALKSNPRAWTFFMAQSRNVMYGRLAILLAGAVLIGYVWFRKNRGKGNIELVDRQAAVACAASLIYAGSFLIAPPTADARYLAPSLFIIWNSCWIWLAVRTNHVVQGNKPSAETLPGSI